MKSDIVNKILNETEIGYDLMAEKFSQTRKFFWRGMEFIGDYAKDRDKILDYGCGNGRLLELFAGKNIEYSGADISQKLIDIAQSKYPNHDFQKISGSQKLPYPDDYFNGVYSIAVFHHVPSKQLKAEMANELYRITKPDGHIIITAWNIWQKPYFKNVLENWMKMIIGKSNLDWNDCYIAFTNNKGEVFNRYHHAFTRRELGKLFSQAGFEIERCDIINSRNIVLIAKK
jgi:ubiquinone/menaquinone biosynthesis C-methylase UbiE